MVARPFGAPACFGRARVSRDRPRLLAGVRLVLAPLRHGWARRRAPDPRRLRVGGAVGDRMVETPELSCTNARSVRLHGRLARRGLGGVRRRVPGAAQNRASHLGVDLQRRHRVLRHRRPRARLARLQLARQHRRRRPRRDRDQRARHRSGRLRHARRGGRRHRTGNLAGGAAAGARRSRARRARRTRHSAPPAARKPRGRPGDRAPRKHGFAVRIRHRQLLPRAGPRDAARPL